MQQKARLLTSVPATNSVPGVVLIDIKDIMEKLDFSKADTVYAWIARGLLPRPLKGTRRTARWVLSEVDAAILALPRGTAQGALPKKAA